MYVHNIFPNFSFNEFHGSGILSLYPYINLLPAVLLSFIIKSRIALMYYFFAFNILLVFIFSFYSCKNFVKSYSIAYLFSIIYGLSNVFLNYGVITNDYGIFSSYIFLPLIIFGFIKLLHYKNNWLELSLGMSFLLFSHILNFVIISIFLLLVLLMNAKKINKYTINSIFKSIILCIVITSVIWLPFFNVYLNNFHSINFPPSVQLNNIPVKLFMSGLYGGKNANTIGFMPLIALIISPLFYKKFKNYIKQIYLLSVIIILSVLFLPFKFITSYGILRLLNQFQYVSRILIIPHMLLSFILSLIFVRYIKPACLRKIIYIFTIFIAIFIQLILGQYIMINTLSNNISMNYFMDKNDKNDKFIDTTNLYGYQIHNSHQFNIMLNTYNPHDNDYIPKSALPISKYVNHNLGFYNNYYKIKVNNIKYNTFDFSGKDGIHKISLPIYVYNREKLNVYLNGKHVNNYANKNGLLTINNIQNNVKSNNKVYIKPALNSFRNVGIILSILGLLFVLIKFVKMKHWFNYFNF